jgi:hypothetical protein
LTVLLKEAVIKVTKTTTDLLNMTLAHQRNVKHLRKNCSHVNFHELLS